jgi:glycosyltransferase involved in cell wall biosynthesis
VTDSVTGVIVMADDYEALTRSAIDLVEQPEIAARMTHEAARKECEGYTWEAARKRWLQAYAPSRHQLEEVQAVNPAC